jgi:hypothetical protein
MLKISENNHSWVAFEASVLAQQKFDSIAIAFAGNSKLDWYLKLWNKRIINNDICQWAWQVAKARIENNSEQLDEFDLNILLSNINLHQELNNPILLNWFNESDAHWLDNLRTNINKLNNETRKALAIYAGILTGNYALSFNEETEFLKRPLSEIFLEMIKIANQIIDNQSYNRATNLEATEFIRRTKVDLLYLNLPTPASILKFLNSSEAWKEAWVSETDYFYDELLVKVKDSPSGLVTTKEAYLQSISQILETAKHIPTWTIVFLEHLPLSLTEMVDEIKKHRSVKAIYLKDLSAIVSQRKTYIIIASEQ